ncbi:hypothetical protein TELCIR_14392 [Teladorsagia circumcincta]|uniref:Uncharacterized protein n=1 Tax=Teladorsagia circumcincta TaxID=45464 RepID=A0A2G9U1B9_TELCI|nr:hypothetical protein TELCIR_14392 [Teladorsagia circumcincta]
MGKGKPICEVLRRVGKGKPICEVLPRVGKDKPICEVPPRVLNKDDGTSPSTSNEPLSSRSLRSTSTKQESSSTAKQPVSNKKSPKKRTSQLANGDDTETNHRSAEENGKGPTAPPKVEHSSLSDFPNGIDFSPITRSGLRISSRGKSRTLPISTSTPMPAIQSPSKAQRKRAKRQPTSPINTDDLEQQPRRKNPLDAKKSRTRSKESNSSSRSPVKAKTAPKPSPRSTRSGRSRGKGN